ncbi:MAG TPA: NAD(P)H-binding protein, partial [Beijerinckiaceae bacterium]
MRVLVVGGYGFIGSAIVRRLVEDGHAVVGVGRDLAAARRRMPEASWIAGDLSRDGVEAWAARLDGIDAVVHAAGVLQDGLYDDVRAVQARGTDALYEACELKGVRRVVHVSAVGASLSAGMAFMATKGEADAALSRRDLDWVILRPSVVVGRPAYGGSALFRGLAALPVLPVVADAGPLQIVQLDD